MPFGRILSDPSILAVLPLLPATVNLVFVLAGSLLGALGAAATLRPAAIKVLARAVWRQKRGVAVLALLATGAFKATELIGSRAGLGKSERALTAPDRVPFTRWPLFRGTLARTGHADRRSGPWRGGVEWSGGRGFQFFSSPAIVGDQVAAVGTRGDSARLFCWDAASGQLSWSSAPHGFRASMSSPVVDLGYLLCGEGLHDTPSSRLMCFHFGDGRAGELAFEFQTASHVECTPVVDRGRVYFCAGDDGVYCLELARGATQGLRVVWHVPGRQYPDAETALAVHDGRVYVGLGYGGEALCVLDAVTGNEIARLVMPFPVFSPPAIQGGRLYVGMGRENYVTQDDGTPGEVRCIDLRSFETSWNFETPAAVLAAIVVIGDDVIFSTVDGQVFVLDDQGHVKRRWSAGARVLSAPAVTERMIYCVSCDGVLTGLDRQLRRVWTVRLGAPGDYISSPVVFGGRVFVGTPDDGLLGVGEPPAEAADEIWPAALGGPGRAGAGDDSLIPPLVDAAWTLAGPSSGNDAEVSAPPAFAGADLVVPMDGADWKGLVCADIADVAAPRRKWTWECPEKIEGSPLISGNILVCLCGEMGRVGRLVGIERSTGNLLWSQGDQLVTGSLGVDADSAYLADRFGKLSRFSLYGERLWEIDVGHLDHPIHVAGEIIAAATKSPNRLTVLDRISGRVLWQAEMRLPPVDSPVIDKTLVFVPTTEAIEIRSLVDGSLQKVVEGWSVSAPMFNDGERFVATTRQGEIVFGSALESGIERRWSGAKPGTPPLVGGNSIVFAADDHRLMRISLEEMNRPEPWYETSGKAPITMPPVLRDGRVYVSVAGAGLVCLKAKSDE